MPIHYDFETDTLYLIGEEKGIQKGIQKGKEKERIETVLKFQRKGMEIPMIANLMDMSIEEVERILTHFQHDNKEQ